MSNNVDALQRADIEVCAWCGDGFNLEEVRWTLRGEMSSQNLHVQCVRGLIAEDTHLEKIQVVFHYALFALRNGASLQRGNEENCAYCLQKLNSRQIRWVLQNRGVLQHFHADCVHTLINGDVYFKRLEAIVKNVLFTVLYTGIDTKTSAAIAVRIRATELPYLVKEPAVFMGIFGSYYGIARIARHFFQWMKLETADIKSIEKGHLVGSLSGSAAFLCESTQSWGFSIQAWVNTIVAGVLTLLRR